MRLSVLLKRHEVPRRRETLVVRSHESLDHVIGGMRDAWQLGDKIPYPKLVILASNLAIANIVRWVVGEKNGVC